MYDYLIVGAGLFGAVFAHEAFKRGKRCLVVEKRGHIGGNAYTKPEIGITVHEYGAHIFHTPSKKIWEYMASFAPLNSYTHRVKAFYKGKRYTLPFNMNTFRELWGTTCVKDAKRIIASQSCADGESLEAHAISMVGKDVYERLIRGYTEKQWGRSARELPAEIIKRIPLRFDYNDRYFSDEYEGIPSGGYTPIIEKMLSGCDRLLNTDYLKNRAELSALAKRIVYTGALDEYFSYEYGELEWRSLCFEKETLAVGDFQGAAVVNYTDRETPFTRIIEHKHFMKECPNKSATIITREYPAAYTRGAEAFYPIADAKNSALKEKYLERARAEKNVIFGGRLGTYSYIDMDDTISLALSAAEQEFNNGQN